MKRLARIAYYCFIALVLLLGVGLLGTQTDVLGAYELRIVQSGSMEPTIKTGSLLLVVPREEYEDDDIITFQTGSGRGAVPTTHRIIDDRLENGELRYVTKGDANENQDAALLDPDDIIGEVVFSLPYLGYLIDFARQPLGFVLLIGIPAVVIIFDEGMTIYRELRRPKKKRAAEADRDAERTDDEVS